MQEDKETDNCRLFSSPIFASSNFIRVKPNFKRHVCFNHILSYQNKHQLQVCSLDIINNFKCNIPRQKKYRQILSEVHHLLNQTGWLSFGHMSNIMQGV